MFLKFNARNGRVFVFRDDRILTDVIAVPPSVSGVLLVNKYNSDNMVVWDSFFIEYSKVNGNFVFICNGEDYSDKELVLCEDKLFIQMTRLLERSVFIDGRTEYFNNSNLKVVNSNKNK